MARIEYLPGVPPEIVGIVAPLLEKWGAIIPTWCHTLRIRYDSGSDDAACIHASDHYRDAIIVIGQHFLGRSGWMREDAVIHELAHMLTARQNQICRDAIQRFVTDDAAREFADAEVMKAIEGANCDIVRAMREVTGDAPAPAEGRTAAGDPGYATTLPTH